MGLSLGLAARHRSAAARFSFGVGRWLGVAERAGFVDEFGQVRCRDGWIQVVEVQPESRKSMPFSDFVLRPGMQVASADSDRLICLPRGSLL